MKFSLLHSLTIENADGGASTGATTAGNIASVDVRVSSEKTPPSHYKQIPKFGKRTKDGFSVNWHDNTFMYKVSTNGGYDRIDRVKETATPGSTNTADFSNDFGTDTPRIPSMFHDLSGKKSLGMGSGFNDFNLKMTDPFSGKRYDLLTVLNTDGVDVDGDSTTKDPATNSPFDQYIPSQEFILKNQPPLVDTPAMKKEKQIKKKNSSLRDRLNKVFLNSINKSVIKGK